MYVFATALLLLNSAFAQQKTIDFEELEFPNNQKFWNGSDESGGFSSLNASFNNSFNSEWESWSGFAYSKMTDVSTAGFENQFSVFAPGKFWNGSDLSEGFSVNGISFNNNYDPTWGSWSGFSYSRVTDNTTEGFGNQFSAISGTGFENSSNYVIYTQGGEITFDEPSTVSEFTVSNTTYAYFSMLNGDMFAAKFEQDDWFLLTIYGWDVAGDIVDSVKYYLADFRDSDEDNHFIINTWETIDLTLLGEVSKLSFALSSSDVGAWGMNTPNYFALGGIKKENGETTVFENFESLVFPSAGNNNSQNYAVWYADGVITFDSLVKVESIAVANSTYAALSIKEGDQFTAAFEQGDWFKLTVYSWSLDGEQLDDSLEVYLADFRDADESNHFVLDEWITLDLSSFVDLGALSFKLSSSDVGDWGMNTPNYFALDHIVYEVLEVEDDLSVANAELISIAVYPNPATDKLTVFAPEGSLIMTDLTGKLIYNEQHESLSEIAVNELPKGMYFLTWSNGISKHSQKIVVQ